VIANRHEPVVRYYGIDTYPDDEYPEKRRSIAAKMTDGFSFRLY
jgi:hypothetical protein